MDAEQRQALLQLSNDFYSEHAPSFDESRQGGWDSWQSIVELAAATRPFHSVLDLGCGNGRFAAFLDQSPVGPFQYRGIDTETQLIDSAIDRYPGKQFVVQDIDTALESDESFDLVVCFGLFHHLPGKDYRERVLNRFQGMLSVGGIAAVSFWQPRLLPNFERKLCPSDSIPGMEANDFLLSWKGDCSKPRYCHHFDEAEIDHLTAATPLELLSQFQGAGNDATNRYLIFRNTL